MELIRAAWNMGAKSESWRAGWLWLGWGVIGGLLPLWGTATLFVLFGKNISLYEFLKNGEFVLYAASFLGGGMFTIRRDVFPSKDALTILFVFLLVISTLVFAAITVTTLGKASGQTVAWLKISEEVLTNMSVAVFVITTIACLVVTVVDSGGAGVDIPAVLKREPKRLEAEFDRLQKETPTSPRNPSPTANENNKNGGKQ